MGTKLYTSRITSAIDDSGERIFTFIKTEELSAEGQKKLKDNLKKAELGQRYFERLSRRRRRFKNY